MGMFAAPGTEQSLERPGIKLMVSTTPRPLNPARVATAAIRGYAYQFDKTVLEVLNAADGVTVTVEGCEDIDLWSADEGTAVQCKYHEAGKFSLAAIRKPLLLMLEAFAGGEELDYRLYAHYGGQKAGTVPSALTVEELKESLTEQKRKPEAATIRHYDSFDDAKLAAFVERLTIETGPSLSEQRERVAATLAESLGCSAEDVADLYYPNAFVSVMQMAMNPDCDQRTTTRSTFLTIINTRPVLFTRWHREFHGQARYVAAIRRRIAALGLLDPRTPRALVLGSDEVGSGCDAIQLTDLVVHVAALGFGPGRLRSAKPWSFLFDAPDDTLRELKVNLIRRGVVFNDGFESLEFSASAFDRDVLVNTRGNLLAAVSYQFRLSSLSTFLQNREQLGALPVSIEFCADDDRLSLLPTTRRVQVAGCDLEEIARILGGPS